VKKVFVIVAMLAITTLAVAATSMLGSGGSAGATTPNLGGAPMIRAAGSTSHQPTIATNWSGYAVTTKPSEPFTYVHSTFIQPKLTCNGTAQEVTSNWVGLDGFDNDTVEQDGTGAVCRRPNYETPSYYAWIEMYPANTVRTFPVSPGDQISASVQYRTGGLFDLTIADLTSHVSRSVIASCSSCARASAEWIVERPAFCTSATKCYLTELANFGETKMSDNVAAVAGGSSEPVSSFPNPYPIFMVQNTKTGFNTLDVTSGLSGPYGGFTETWERYGSVTPIKL
jgi:hypothetical protein